MNKDCFYYSLFFNKFNFWFAKFLFAKNFYREQSILNLEKMIFSETHLESCRLNT